MHHALARRGLPPGEHAADSGYASADLLLAARARGITLLAPVPPDSSPQARSGGYAAARSGRQLGFRHRQIHEALTAARAGQASDAWQRKYRIRAGIEGTIAQATHVTGIRRARYLGLGKTRLEHNTAAAINLIRLDAWWDGKPLDRTRTTHLQRLDLAA